MNKFIIDGYNLVFRAHYAFQTFITSTGLLSGNIYGFFTIMRSLRYKYPACEFVVVWDTHATRKKGLYPEYKANRNHSNVDVQIKDIKNACKCLKIIQVEAQGEEADDVIATVCQNVDGIAYIYSSDKDLLQLVKDGKIVVVRPKVGATAERIYDEEAVKKEFLVSPSDLACYLSFKGDTVDNVPGVERVPSKVLASLSREYHTTAEIYKNLHQEKLTDHQRRSIQAAESQVTLNFDLVKLRTDLDCLIFTSGFSNTEEFAKLLSKYEIKAIVPSSYIDLFEKDLSFSLRTGPGHPILKTLSLFDDEGV
jgi:DNA polymerase-1